MSQSLPTTTNGPAVANQNQNVTGDPQPSPGSSVISPANFYAGANAGAGNNCAMAFATGNGPQTLEFTPYQMTLVGGDFAYIGTGAIGGGVFSAANGPATGAPDAGPADTNAPTKNLSCIRYDIADYNKQPASHSGPAVAGGSAGNPSDKTYNISDQDCPADEYFMGPTDNVA